MTDYSQGKIYKIIDIDTGSVFIGSTVQTMEKRMSKHVEHFKSYSKGKGKFMTAFKVMKNNNFQMELIEDYPCKSRNELELQELYWTNEIDCVNKVKTNDLDELGKPKHRYYKHYN